MESSEEKKAREYLSGKIKKSPSYHTYLADLTFEELILASKDINDKGKSSDAKDMIKLIKQNKRLSQKGSEGDLR